ncbi:MAG: glycoside hydrolase family 88 protein [Clostridia bacterium]|nr:glycoside hydrolase family 88 protein [Clostridia bacterium]
MKKVLSALLILTMLFSLIPFSAAAEGTYTYEELEGYVKKVNDYWIATHTWTPGYEWDTATYYIGCMDAYYLTGIEKYRDYATTWAEHNSWQGHGSNDKSSWKGNNNVFHADNQTCFQVYIDLYNLSGQKDEKKIARTMEVTDAQLATGKTDYWTWCDAIHMAMPVYSKLYTLTGDEKYLDFMYNSFMWSKKRMYDGEDGINYEGAPANLFFRDPGYIKSKVNNQKNIWARGVGWVMAAYARVFEDMPKDSPYYEDIKKTYLEMAKACIDCARVDSEGRVFWTQSMLADFPKSDINPYGYETSGTGFITYSLYYGINAGLLDKATYLPYAEGGIKYLTEVAIHPDGFVGYTQHIGSAATNATTTESNFNFGVGATLYALCEAARYYGGVRGDMYPYLTRKTMGTVSFKVGSDYVYNGMKVNKLDAAPFVNNEGNTMVPLRALGEALGAKVVWNDDLKAATIVKNDTVLQFAINSPCYYVDSTRFMAASAPALVNGRTYLPLRVAAEALGRKLYWNGDKKIIIIGGKDDIFLNCQLPLLDMLDNILTTGTLPSRPEQEGWEYKVVTPELESENKIEIVSAVANKTPEIENPAENAFDNDLSTRWAATDDCEIVFDLGKEQHVELVGVSFWKYAERSTKYEIHASKDGINYIGYFNGEAKQGVEFNYTPIKETVRYIKLVGHGTSTGPWTSLLELIPYSK